MASTSRVALIEKIVRAEVILESMRLNHGHECIVNDLESSAPCSCGASVLNRKIDSVLQILTLE